jgi:acyl-CoA thioesterase FadM
MYPFFRMAKEKARYRNARPLPLLGVHKSSHICWPWDLDPWIELNNGRTLTLFDLGRIPLFSRIGIKAALRREGWRMTVAGVTVRYRHRIEVFHKVAMQSRLLGWDGRFFYVDQSMWNQKGACTTQAIYRIATTGGNGIIAPEKVVAAMDTTPPGFTLPDWVQAWIDAENQRNWPPERL